MLRGNSLGFSSDLPRLEISISTRPSPLVTTGMSFSAARRKRRIAKMAPIDPSIRAGSPGPSPTAATIAAPRGCANAGNLVGRFLPRLGRRLPPAVFFVSSKLIGKATRCRPKFNASHGNNPALTKMADCAQNHFRNFSSSLKASCLPRRNSCCA